jgi:hypothetical protein
MIVGTPSLCGLVVRTTGNIGSNDTMRCESLEREFESILEAIEWKLKCHTRMFNQCGPPPAYDGVPHLEALVVQAVDS